MHGLRHIACPAAAAMAALLPQPALAAATLTCAGAKPTGSLYDTTATCAGVENLQNMFSGLVCNFQRVLDEVLSNVYCGIQFTMMPTLTLLISVYIMVFGAMLLMGTAQLNTKEVMIRLFKIVGVWTFATQSAWGIGLAYNFFISFSQEGIVWVLSILFPFPLPPGVSEQFVFMQLDQLLFQIITGPFMNQNSKIIGFIIIMSINIPPIFMMFSYYLLQTFRTLARALFGYLLGISAIAFLIALSPIFLSFMLFQITFHFFDSWLKYLISYTLQIIIIFAAIAMWFAVMSVFGSFFGQLASVIVPDQTVQIIGGERTAKNSWGICDYTFTYTALGPVVSCKSALVIPASAVIEHNQFVYYIIYNIVTLVIVAYAFDALMRNIPDIAKQLSGPKYVPSLAGGIGAQGAGSPVQAVQSGMNAAAGRNSAWMSKLGERFNMAKPKVDLGNAAGEFIRRQHDAAATLRNRLRGGR